MKAATSPQISHESETQRQYPRFLLPSRAHLEGKEHEVKNLSAGGVALYDVGPGYTRGSRVTLNIELPFHAFSLGTKISAEVQYYNTKDKVLGCRFIHQSAEQVSLLNHAIRSFIGGEIVTSDNILSIAKRNNFTKERQHVNNNTAGVSFWRQLPGLLLVLLVGFVVATLIGNNLYNSMFVVRAADATVAAPTVAFRAVAQGVFTWKVDPSLPLVQPNTVMGTITPVDGGPAITLKSPCNCYITKVKVPSGELATNDQEIATLVPVDAKPWIIAEIDPAQGKKLSPETSTEVSIFGSNKVYTGHITSMESALSGTRVDGDRSVLMKIVPDQKLPLDFVNRMAAVTFSIH